MEVTSSKKIYFNVENNDQDPKFEVGDHVRISKYKNIFAKGYNPNRSEEVSLIKKVKNTMPWTCVISDLNGEEIVRMFYKKELQKQIKQSLEFKKVVKRKGDKPHVKCKGYDSTFNSYIDKKNKI